MIIPDHTMPITAMAQYFFFLKIYSLKILFLVFIYLLPPELPLESDASATNPPLLLVFSISLSPPPLLYLIRQTGIEKGREREEDEG